MSSAAEHTYPPLRRDPDDSLVAGVCAAVAKRVGIDPLIVRVGFAVVVIATAGVALLAYAIAWAAIPELEGPDAERVRPARNTARNWRVAAGVGLLALSLLLVLRELGIWWSDALIWPLILAAFGATLLWRQARQPTAGGAAAAPGRPEPPAAERQRRLVDLYRGGFGVALVVGAVLLFLSANDVLGDTREVVFTVIAAAAGLALILAPFLWRLGRNLADERAERIRSQERAEVAAHLHDSVLQTLALVQQRADDPRAVAQLARRQERELRAWLFDGDGRNGDSFAAAIDAAAAEVEDAHAVAIDVVTVGDRTLDDRAAALVAATREALVNAAKFAGEAGPIAVYAEAEGDAARVFVRDRGSGFDPLAVPADRRGLRESIIGRMERHGGTATVRSNAGSGTEVELALEVEAP
jgi:signal transduction histidine kinase